MYENVIPMWQTIREGNWKLVEKAVRNFAKQLSVEPVTLVAGTRGNLTLSAGQVFLRIPITPDHYENAYGTVVFFPVPSEVFKCVQNRQGEGIALITHNNPYLKTNELELNGLCKSTTNDCHRMYPDFKNFTRGYTYCCDVKNLPKDLRTRCVAKNEVISYKYNLLHDHVATSEN